MKNLLKISVVASIMFLMSGCGALIQVQTPKPLKNEILVGDEGKGEYSFTNRADIERKTKKGLDSQLAETLYTVAVYGKQKGFQYFAITKKNISNLNGFPINDYENLLKYCELKGRGHFRSLCWDYNHDSEGIITMNSVDLKVKYFKESVPGLFLYSIDETIKNTVNKF